jgi:hypothetical protein
MSSERRIHALLLGDGTNSICSEVYLKLIVDRGITNDKRLSFIFSDEVIRNRHTSATQFAKIIEAGFLLAGPEGDDLKDYLVRMDAAFEGYKVCNDRMTPNFKMGTILGILRFGISYEPRWKPDKVEQALIDQLIVVALRCGGGCTWTDEVKGVLSRDIKAFYETSQDHACRLKRKDSLINAFLRLPKLLKYYEGKVAYGLGLDKDFTEPVMRELVHVLLRWFSTEKKIEMVRERIETNIRAGQRWCL